MGKWSLAYDESMSHKKGQWEFGPGLYLTTKWETANKYSKGPRKLYRVTLEKGNNAWDVTLPFEDAVEFVKTYGIGTKRKGVLERLERYRDGLKAEVLINLLVNMDALRSSDSGRLRVFLVEHGVDYSIVDNAFGWGERMVVLFNMKKILKKEIITPKHRIEEYDLPTRFTEDE